MGLPQSGFYHSILEGVYLDSQLSAIAEPGEYFRRRIGFHYLSSHPCHRRRDRIWDHKTKTRRIHRHFYSHKFDRMLAVNCLFSQFRMDRYDVGSVGPNDVDAVLQRKSYLAGQRQRSSSNRLFSSFVGVFLLNSLINFD